MLGKHQLLRNATSVQALLQNNPRTCCCTLVTRPSTARHLSWRQPCNRLLSHLPRIPARLQPRRRQLPGCSCRRCPALHYQMGERPDVRAGGAQVPRGYAGQHGHKRCAATHQQCALDLRADGLWWACRGRRSGWGGHLVGSGHAGGLHCLTCRRLRRLAGSGAGSAVGYGLHSRMASSTASQPAYVSKHSIAGTAHGRFQINHALLCNELPISVWL